MQQFVIVQIVDFLGAAVFLEIFRRGDHAFGRLGQFAGAQGAVFQLTDAHGHVEAFGDQLNVAVVEDHVDGDVGEVAQEFRENRTQMVDAKVRGHRDAQQT